MIRLFVVWSSLVGCKKPEPTSQPSPSTVVDLTATGASSAYVPPVLEVAVSGAVGTTYVEYALDGEPAFGRRTPDASAGPVSVLGLKGGRAATWRAVVVDAEGVRHESEPATFDVPVPPAALLPLTLEVADEAATVQYVASGVIRSQLDSFLAIADRDGDWVWWVSTEGTVLTTPELGLDRRSLVWTQYDFGRVADVGKLVRVGLDGRTRTETRLRLGHHDFVQHDDGSIAFLGISFADITIGADTYRMASDTISRGPEGMTDADTPELLFDMFADFPLEPVVTCSHIATPEQKFGEPSVNEWTHGNSFMYLPETGLYYVNDKMTDWFFALEPDTGEVVWVMNGREGDFTQPGGAPIWVDVQHTSLWSHGHMSDVWDGGGMLFDNGDHHVPPRSAAVEFAWDEAAMTAELVWSYPHPDGAFTPALGDVRRMPDDHVLVTWADIGTVDEVDRDLNLLWRVRNTGDQQIGRIVPITDLYAP